MKLFIDAGTNLGQGLKQFNNKFNFFSPREGEERWEVCTFEPNPNINVKNVIKNVFPSATNITAFPKALWTRNGTLKFTAQGKATDAQRDALEVITIPEKELQGGGSHLAVVDKQFTPDNVHQKHNVVPCIDFASFLKKKSKHFSSIIVKLDVEGAEFRLIDHLIETNTLCLISQLYCETHEHFFYPSYTPESGLSAEDAPKAAQRKKKFLEKIKKACPKLAFHNWH